MILLRKELFSLSPFTKQGTTDTANKGNRKKAQPKSSASPTKATGSDAAPNSKSPPKKKPAAQPAARKITTSPKSKRNNESAAVVAASADSVDDGDESAVDSQPNAERQMTKATSPAANSDNNKRGIGSSSMDEGIIVSRKRIASLNASAFMAANYETEQTLDRNFSVTDDESSEEEEDEDDEDEAAEGVRTEDEAKSQSSSVPSSRATTKGSRGGGSSAAGGGGGGGKKRAPKKVKKESDVAKTVSGYRGGRCDNGMTKERARQMTMKGISYCVAML